MGILAWIIFGLLAGIVAKFIMPGIETDWPSTGIQPRRYRALTVAIANVR